MDMRPTSVAAVICQALSPLPTIQYGYGLTVFTLLRGLACEGAMSGTRVAPPGLLACPGRSAYVHATVHVSHGRVSRAFPVCYAAGNVPGQKRGDVSRMYRGGRPACRPPRLLPVTTHYGEGISFP